MGHSFHALSFRWTNAINASFVKLKDHSMLFLYFNFIICARTFQKLDPHSNPDVFDSEDVGGHCDAVVGPFAAVGFEINLKISCSSIS